MRNNQATATTTRISAQSNAAYLLIEAGSKTTTNSTTSDIAAEEVSEAIATNVGYNGIMLCVYIWIAEVLLKVYPPFVDKLSL